MCKCRNVAACQASESAEMPAFAIRHPIDELCPPLSTLLARPALQVQMCKERARIAQRRRPIGSKTTGRCSPCPDCSLQAGRHAANDMRPPADLVSTPFCVCKVPHASSSHPGRQSWSPAPWPVPLQSPVSDRNKGCKPPACLAWSGAQILAGPWGDLQKGRFPQPSPTDPSFLFFPLLTHSASQQLSTLFPSGVSLHTHFSRLSIKDTNSDRSSRLAELPILQTQVSLILFARTRSSAKPGIRLIKLAIFDQPKPRRHQTSQSSRFRSPNNQTPCSSRASSLSWPPASRWSPPRRATSPPRRPRP